jgi:hypothetical protein
VTVQAEKKTNALDLAASGAPNVALARAAATVIAALTVIVARVEQLRDSRTG